MPDVGAFPEVVRLPIDGTYHRFVALLGKGEDDSTSRRKEEIRGQFHEEDDATHNSRRQSLPAKDIPPVIAN